MRLWIALFPSSSPFNPGLMTSMMGMLVFCFIYHPLICFMLSCTFIAQATSTYQLIIELKTSWMGYWECAHDGLLVHIPLLTTFGRTTRVTSGMENRIHLSLLLVLFYLINDRFLDDSFADLTQRIQDVLTIRTVYDQMVRYVHHLPPFS